MCKVNNIHERFYTYRLVGWDLLIKVSQYYLKEAIDVLVCS